MRLSNTRQEVLLLLQLSLNLALPVQTFPFRERGILRRKPQVVSLN